mmetsp:Transcript_20789/g.49513  ORF Transcript_20789/g.49513 Transcript_20789/m.49513 type:complete len:252 (-) Transcript_20789:21-776(-)
MRDGGRHPLATPLRVLGSAVPGLVREPRDLCPGSRPALPYRSPPVPLPQRSRVAARQPDRNQVLRASLLAPRGQGRLFLALPPPQRLALPRDPAHQLGRAHVGVPPVRRAAPAGLSRSQQLVGGAAERGRGLAQQPPCLHGQRETWLHMVGARLGLRQSVRACQTRGRVGHQGSNGRGRESSIQGGVQSGAGNIQTVQARVHHAEAAAREGCAAQDCDMSREVTWHGLGPDVANGHQRGPRDSSSTPSPRL